MWASSKSPNVGKVDRAHLSQLACENMPRLIVQNLVAVVAICWGAIALGQQNVPSALLVLGAGEALSADLLDDVTEAVLYSVGQAEKVSFIPKERCQESVGYSSPREPGSCGFDDECVRSKRATLGVERFIIVRVTPTTQGYRIQVTSVGQAAENDRTATGNSTRSSSDLINQIRRLVVPLFQQLSVTLQVISSASDAQVFVDEKPVGAGTVSLSVEAGNHSVRVTSPGHVPFETTANCVAGGPCIVRAVLVKAGDSTSPDVPLQTTDIVRWSGWATAGVGVAMTVVGTVYGFKARAYQQELDDSCQGRICARTQSKSSKTLSAGEDAAMIFNAVGIPGMVLAAGGATLVILSYLDVFSESESSARILPSVDADGGVHLHTEWRF